MGGMGFLLVFFPEYNSSIDEKSKLFPSPSSTSSPSHCFPNNSPNTSFRRSNSSVILSKAQSTISICAFLFFITLLLFTLSTFEPTNNSLSNTVNRRFLSQKPPISKIPTAKTETRYWFTKLLKPNSYNAEKTPTFPSFALQKMGTLFMRGTKAMSDLVVGHVAEDVSDEELRLFLRLIHRSGLTARSDVIFLFPSHSFTSRFAPIIQEENDSFLKLINHYKDSSSNRTTHKSSFNFAAFYKMGKNEKEMGEPLWGKRGRSNSSNTGAGGSGSDESTRLSYGSVLSFDAVELDPEISLSGFLDHVPMNLRRWACYPMLLGRVRRNFKHVMLVDVKNLMVVKDPLNRVRNRSPESVFLFAKPEGKHHKKNSDKTQSHHSVNSAILMGGARGIRRLSNAMLMEIVRATMQHKKKSGVTESGVLSQLVGNEFILKNVALITTTESIPDTSSVAGRGSPSLTSLTDYVVIQRGTINHYDLKSFIMKQICSLEAESSVYKDC